MVVRDNAPFQLAGYMGGGAVSVSVLSAHTPAACLPQGAQILGMIGPQLIAFEAIGEDRLLWVTTESLPQH